MNRITGFLKSAGAAFSSIGQAAARTISLTAPFLQNILWLITQRFRELTNEGYKANAAVYACLRLLATSVPEPPLIPYTRLPSGDPGVPLDWNHPLRQLIRRPNPLMTEYEMWELTTIQCGIGGISHWFKERNNLGQTKALWPLRPDRMGPVYSSENDTDNPVISGWSYQVPGTTQYAFLAHRDVMTFNFPDPMGESGGIAEGLGPMAVLAAEVGADNEATRFVGHLVTNYAQPGLVIQTQGKISTQEDAELIKASFIRQFSGARRGTPAVLDSGSTIASTGFTLQQLEFPNLRKVSESRIAAAFGVPAILVGLLVGLESGIKATTDELRSFFAETTLSSYWRRYSDQFTNDVAEEFDDNVVCLFDLSKVRSLATMASIRLNEVRDGYERGAVTVDEYRDALDLPRRKDGDVYMYGIAPGRGIGQPTAAEQATTTSNLSPDKGTDAPAKPQEPQGNDPKNPSPSPANDMNRRIAAANGSKALDLSSVSAADVSRGHDLTHSAFDDLMEELEMRRKAPV